MITDLSSSLVESFCAEIIKKDTKGSTNKTKRICDLIEMISESTNECCNNANWKINLEKMA